MRSVLAAREKFLARATATKRTTLGRSSGRSGLMGQVYDGTPDHDQRPVCARPGKVLPDFDAYWELGGPIQSGSIRTEPITDDEGGIE